MVLIGRVERCGVNFMSSVCGNFTSARIDSIRCEDVETQIYTIVRERKYEIKCTRKRALCVQNEAHSGASYKLLMFGLE